MLNTYQLLLEVELMGRKSEGWCVRFYFIIFLLLLSEI